jgi:hypothetical protein
MLFFLLLLLTRCANGWSYHYYWIQLLRRITSNVHSSLYIERSIRVLLIESWEIELRDHVVCVVHTVVLVLMCDII